MKERTNERCDLNKYFFFINLGKYTSDYTNYVFLSCTFRYQDITNTFKLDRSFL